MVVKNSDKVMFIKHRGQPGEEREGKNVAGRENNMRKGPEVGRSLIPPLLSNLTYSPILGIRTQATLGAIILPTTATFFKVIIYLCIFWFCWVFIAAQAFLWSRKQELLFVGVLRLLIMAASLVAQALGTRASAVAALRLGICSLWSAGCMGFSSCGSWA